jgi:hypothetical protein
MRSASAICGGGHEAGRHRRLQRRAASLRYGSAHRLEPARYLCVDSLDVMRQTAATARRAVPGIGTHQTVAVRCAAPSLV